MDEQQPKPKPPPLMLRGMQWYFGVLGYFFPKIAGKHAYNLWFQPTRFKAPDREQQAIESATITYLNAEGYKIKIWSWGKGPAVLFLHGWSGRGTQAACFIPHLVKAGYRVVSFDGPAHGDSSGKSTDILKYSEILKIIIKRFGPWHAVVTHSFGAMVFTLTYDIGMDFKKFIFISPPATMKTPLSHFQKLLKLPNKVAENMKKRLLNEYGDDLFKRISIVENIKKIERPILIIHDKDDFIVSINDGKSVSEACKQGKLMQTQSLGHMKVLYDSQVIQDAINFLR